MVALVMLASLVTAADQGELEFSDEASTGARVTGKVATSMSRDITDKVRLSVKAKDLDTPSNSVFEVWLMDSFSGHKTSIGAFTTKNGRGDFRYAGEMVNFRIYDQLVITKEPRHDLNPAPSEIILVAELPVLGSIELAALLRGSKEVPPNDSPATGRGMFIVDPDHNRVMYTLQYQGLEAAETGAHIHGPASSSENAPVLHPLPLGKIKNGVWRYDESLEGDLLHGRMYVNVHSEEYPGGEIRSQLFIP